MVSLLKLEFYDNKLVYAPGDTIKGNVVISSDSGFTANKLMAKFRGKSHNRWYDPARKMNVQQEEDYAKSSQILWPQTQSFAKSGENAFPVGTQKLPFSFDIPGNAPCSFEGSVGWVRYSINVVLEIPNHFDKEKKVFITVLPKADLNLDQRAKTSPRLELKEGVGFLGRKFVSIVASCNKGGYVPGEPINVVLDIANDSDKDITKVTAILEQKAAFTARCFCTTRKVVKTNALKMSEAFEIKNNTSSSWRKSLIVPSLPPSDLPGCSIIDLQYRLLLKLKCGTLSTISFKLPFIIGTVPLITGNEVQTPGAFDVPPSYMESVFGKVDGVEDENEELLQGDQYSPLYGYYQWPKS